jgi:hypothetical protein
MVECVAYMSPAENDAALDEAYAYAQINLEWEAYETLKDLLAKLKAVAIQSDPFTQKLEEALHDFESVRTPPFPKIDKEEEARIEQELMNEEIDAMVEYSKTPEGMLYNLNEQLKSLAFISKAAEMRDAVLKWWVLHEHEIIRLQGQEIHKYNTEPTFVTLAKQLKKGLAPQEEELALRDELMNLVGEKSLT